VYNLLKQPSSGIWVSIWGEMLETGQQYKTCIYQQVQVVTHCYKDKELHMYYPSFSIEVNL